MKPIRTFTIIPSLPEALEPLRTLANNLRWAWNHDTIELFRRLDDALWETVYHNPVLMLGKIEQEKLERAAQDDAFLAHLQGVKEDLESYLSNESWFSGTHHTTSEPIVAYFSAEFGLTECLSIFAGGLGLLSGDHIKSASDLGIPLVGVGLLYQQGYFTQYLNETGWQQEAYRDNDFHNLPLTLERNPDGSPVYVEVDIAGKPLKVQVWRVQVGRVFLFLLDTNIGENPPEFQGITGQLYGGDLDMRIRQEIVLGIGGFRVLRALGIAPRVCHMNEGHSAFLALEWIRYLMQENHVSFAEAREAACAGLIFTTHTPVPAGHDSFDFSMMERYFGQYARQLGLDFKEFMALGQSHPGHENDHFCLTVLALRLAAASNGVSRLHSRVSRRMWNHIWPNLPENEIPISCVTNGVHFRSWISREMNELYERYLGPRWREEPANSETWSRVDRVPDEELWRTHERRRQRLITFTRRRFQAQLEHLSRPKRESEAADYVLDTEALTIGFARRFATYKRATLLLTDPGRLARILDDQKRPVQIIFAGKAHPRDDAGKEIIRRIVELSRQEPFCRHLVFLEDFDMAIARSLVQGVDVWLNNPRPPLEASGTSGMKAAANGVLNLSTVDGWWDEVFHDNDFTINPVGWNIGRGETYDDAAYQDQVEANALYDILEQEVIPLFYERGRDGLPRGWIKSMKASIATLSHFYNTHRMVREYTERLYLPALDRFERLHANNLVKARELAGWKNRLAAAWPQIKVRKVAYDGNEALPVGETLNVQAWVELGTISPEEILVELYLGVVDAKGNFRDPEIIALQAAGPDPLGGHLFTGRTKPFRRTGRHGATVRVRPYHPDLQTAFLPDLLTWADRL